MKIPVIIAALLSCAFASPARALEREVWQWSLFTAFSSSPEASPYAAPADVLPAGNDATISGLDLIFDISFGSARGVGGGMSYMLTPDIRLEADFSLISSPIKSIGVRDTASSAILESTLEELARAALARPVSNDPDDIARREEAAKNTNLIASTFVDNSGSGDYVNLALSFNAYYDILKSRPYAIFVGAGGGFVWSRLDDSVFTIQHLIVSEGVVAATGEVFRANTGLLQYESDELDEIRATFSLYAGLQQELSEKFGLRTSYEYQWIEGSGEQARGGGQTIETFRFGLDFAF